MFEVFLSVVVKGVGVKQEASFLNTKMVVFSLLATLPIMFILNFLANSFSSAMGMLHASAFHGDAVEILVEQIKENDDGDEMQCAVCLNEVCKGEKFRVLPKCNHGYHVACIDSWLQTNPSCPICRSEVRVKCVRKKCRFEVFVSFFSSLFEGLSVFFGLSVDSIEDGHYFC